MRALTALAGRLAALTGWRRAVVAGGLGVLVAGAQAPVYFLPAILAFSALPWLLTGAQNGRAAFAIGWWFGFGMLTAGLYWISNALLVDSARHAWLVPFAAAGLPAVLAVYYGAATWLTHALARRGGAPVIILAASWAIAEWLRGNLFTGFPWNLTGYVWAFSEIPLQATAFIGSYGLGLVTLCVGFALAPLGMAPPGPQRWYGPLAAAATLALLWAGGSLRLAEITVGPTEHTVRVVQGNVAQRDKWQGPLKADHIARYLAMTTAPGADGRPPPPVAIWPETAMALFLNEAPALRAAMGRAVAANGSVLTGTVRVARPSPAGSDAPSEIWNSVYAIDGGGAVRAIYDKFHLVPFGEYLPFQDWLPFLPVAALRTGFSAGPGPQTLTAPGLPPFSPLICYEIIFPGAVRAPDGPPPRLLINLTNDAWYGVSSGPYQHFATTRVRAVEEGLPVIRAANTGISALIDPLGRVKARLALNQTGHFDHAVPAALSAPTLYSRWGEVLFLTAVIAMLVGGMLFGRQRR